MKLQLFELIAKQPAFDQLRSVEQLGYITSLSRMYVDAVFLFIPWSFSIQLNLLYIYQKFLTLNTKDAKLPVL